MPETEDIGSFFKENKKLAKEYLDIRLEIYKLRLIRIFSRFAGHFLWIVISLFLVSLFIIFLGVTAGFWLSSLTGSYVKGFGLVSLTMLTVVILLTLLRKALFVNPIIRSIINKTKENTTGETEQ